MSTIVDEGFKRWPAKRKAELLMNIIHGVNNGSSDSAGFVYED